MALPYPNRTRRGLCMTLNSLVFTVVASSGLLFITPVAAQVQQGDPFVFKFEGGGAHQSEADLNDGNGGFAVDRWFLNAGVDYGWTARNSVGISVGGGKSIYDFNESSDFGGGTPWGNIDDFRVTLTARFGFGETGTIMIVPSLRYDGESDAKSGDSQTFGVFGAVAWRINESLTIGPGIGVFSRLENGTKVFPLLAIDWTFNEKWNLSTGRGLASSQGPGLSLTYRLNDDWSLGLTGRYENREFRLGDDGPAPGGIGRDQSIPMVAGAILQPNPKMSFSVFAGLSFAGKLRLKDSSDMVVDESDYDLAALFGATFEFRF